MEIQSLLDELHLEGKVVKREPNQHLTEGTQYIWSYAIKRLVVLENTKHGNNKMKKECELAIEVHFEFELSKNAYFDDWEQN